VRSITSPSPGNHDYGDPGAAGYFDYFGSRAGSPSLGYYAFDVGSWRVLSLNSNCSNVACDATSTQVRWLQDDLRRHPYRCALAYFHHPAFSSGMHGDEAAVAELWRALHDAGVDVVLVGHDHDYERFVPLDAEGSPSASGVREFVVGTGGAELRNEWPHLRAISARRQATSHGVLEMQLWNRGYSWSFRSVGDGFHDVGASTCR
jgi:alkaline phosphatase